MYLNAVVAVAGTVTAVAEVAKIYYNSSSEPTTAREVNSKPKKSVSSDESDSEPETTTRKGKKTNNERRRPTYIYVDNEGSPHPIPRRAYADSTNNQLAPYTCQQKRTVPMFEHAPQTDCGRITDDEYNNCTGQLAMQLHRLMHLSGASPNNQMAPYPSVSKPSPREKLKIKVHYAANGEQTVTKTITKY